MAPTLSTTVGGVRNSLIHSCVAIASSTLVEVLLHLWLLTCGPCKVTVYHVQQCYLRSYIPTCGCLMVFSSVCTLLEAVACPRTKSPHCSMPASEWAHGALQLRRIAACPTILYCLFSAAGKGAQGLEDGLCF